MLPSDLQLASASGEFAAFLAQVFRAGQAAEIVGVPPDTLAHWRKNNVVKFAKADKGWTRYSGRDLAQFAVIRDAQHLGYSYDLAKEFAEFAGMAADDLIDLVTDWIKLARSEAELADFCLIGVYSPVDLDGPSLSDRRKATEARQPFSGPLVRLFTSREKLKKYLSQRRDQFRPLEFAYLPTIERLAQRWAAISSGECL
ncbi:MAG: helix-turn-helix domain-containing protein [Hyphomonas sp.]